MFLTSEDQMKAETKILEGFIRNYENYKDYIVEASEEEKQTPRYRHRKRIVEGVEKVYPTLSDETKKIFDMRYGSDQEYDFADIADELFDTTSRVKRLRDVIIEKFAVAIGWK